MRVSHLSRANGRPNSVGELAERHRLIGYVDDLIDAPGLNYTRDFLRNWRSAFYFL